VIINIIHLKNNNKFPHREERERNVIKQMEMEKCEYRFWDGVEGQIHKVNIHKAHKQIIQYAKESNLSGICVAEDDLQWTGTGAWKYFLDNEPKDADMYVGGYYPDGSHDENFLVKKFHGLTLYILYKKAYDLFLSMPEYMHLDAAFGMSEARIIVCPKFIVRQREGYSDQRNGYFRNDIKKGKPVYGQ